MISKLNKILLPEDQYPWTVDKIIRPNIHQTLLLISRKDEIHCYDDGVVPTLISLIDVNNDYFYPYTKKNLSLIKKFIRNRESEKEDERKLSDVWLKTVKKIQPGEF